MEHKLKQLHKTKSLSLTSEERVLLKSRMVQLVSATPVQQVESLFHRGVQHGLRIALSTFIFIVFIGGSISAVADNSLPGDPLYTFKVNVNEEVKGLFLRTPEEKAVWLKARVDTRLGEIITLADNKSLTQHKQAAAQKALTSHVKALSKELTTLSDKSPNSALVVTANLEENIKANKAALIKSNTPNTEGTEDAIKTMDGMLEKVTEQEVKIISKEIDNISSDVKDTEPTTDTDIDPEVKPTPPAEEPATPSAQTTTPVGP